MVPVATQLSVLGLYLPPVFKKVPLSPPQIIISLPVHTAVWVSRLSGALVVLVAVQLSVPGLYFPPVFTVPANRKTAPDDHFTASPDTRVKLSGLRRISGAGGYPAVGAGIISPAGIQVTGVNIESSPGDHFTAGPYRRMRRSWQRCIGDAGSCPGIRTGIVSPTRIKIGHLSIKASPDDHFTAGPYRGVSVSGGGRIARACTAPSIIARAFHLLCRRYHRKGITPKRHFVSLNEFYWLGYRVTGILIRHSRLKQALCQCWPGQALGYNKGIVSERFK